MAGNSIDDRLKKLKRDFSDLDQDYMRLASIAKLLSSCLGGLVPDDAQDQIKDALASLQKDAAARPLRIDELDQSVNHFKDTILFNQLAGLSTPDKGAGLSVAIGILSSLKLGDTQFDKSLEEAIPIIKKHIENQDVRSAMAMVADLMDQFRTQLESKQGQGLNALQEVLTEVLDTEGELSKAFEAAQNRMVAAGKKYDDSLGATAGALTRAAAQDSVSLVSLKSAVVRHVRSLRDTVKTRRESEKQVLAQTRSELNQMRNTLANTREHMLQLEAHNKKWSREALTDPITGVANKRAFSNELEHALAERGNWPFSLIVLDIDFFKTINDSFGHQAGDKALATVTARVGARLRGTDTLFRYAGDEFVIILLNTTLADAMIIAERAREAALEIRFRYRGQNEHRVSLSLGVTEVASGDTAETIFNRADKALLIAKQNGRNQVRTAPIK